MCEEQIIPPQIPDMDKSKKSSFFSKRNISLIIILLILLVIIIFTMVLSFSRQKSSLVSQNKISQTTKQQPNKQPSKWIRSNSNTFSVQYPPNWQLQSRPVIDGGTLDLIYPLGLPQGVKYPQIILESDPYTSLLFTQKTQSVLALGLKKSFISLNGIQVEKLSGSLSSKFIPLLGGQPLQETVLIERKNNTLYQFEYTYVDAQPDANLESFFNNIITSIKTH